MFGFLESFLGKFVSVASELSSLCVFAGIVAGIKSSFRYLEADLNQEA
jgi:hypothetical protein